MKISELKPGMRNIDLTFKIDDISQTRDVMSREGKSLRVADATVSDDSGKVKLTLWNEQIDEVAVNNSYSIQNGYITSYRGETQLNVGRLGKLVPAEGK